MGEASETPPAAGKRLAAEELLPLFYDELKKLAAARLGNEPSGQTLQPTAVVHEAYVRLVGGSNPEQWNSEGHFFGAAAIAIRRVLIDNARRKQSVKRGGELQRRELDSSLLGVEPREDLIALDAALDRLALVDANAAKLVQLRYFAGLTLVEAADVLEMPARTAGRLWSFARAWLRREVEGRDSG